MKFEREYAAWLEKHLRARSGERLRRLEKGHGHAEKELLEKVVWPALGTFEHLHPEYEAKHFNGKKYFLDIALVKWPLMVNFEADGFSSHVTGMDRGKFCAEKRRDVQLQLAGWRIVRIAYDDIVDQPEQWQQAVKGLISLWNGEIQAAEALNGKEREIERLVRSAETVSVPDICRLLDVSDRTARHYLKELQRKKVLVPAITGRERVYFYKLSPERRVML